MIGTKFYKNNYDLSEYASASVWCNETQKATIEDRGEYYEVVEIPAPTLEEAKAEKITQLKALRDTKEVEDILVNGHMYDYDEKARERINAAIIALDVSGGSIMWTLADNTDTEVTATDLKYVIAMVAQRSNALHMKYRTLKESVENAQSKEEVEAVNWED